MGESRVRNLFIRIGAFRKFIEEEKPDLIHIEMSESLITYGFIERHFRDRKFIYTDRGLLFGYRKRSRLFMFPVLKKSHMLVTTTAYNAGLWRNETDIKPITTIPNTISSKHFGTYEPEKRKKSDDFVVGLAGRICVEKDWDFALEFIRELKKRIDALKVSIVLSTYEKGDDEKVSHILGTLKDILGESSVTSGLNLSQEEMSEFYYTVDVFLMTSCFESFGKAAVEAMSRKCAVVSTSVGGLPEVIGDERYLYTKEDFGKGIDCIERLFNDREELLRAGEYFYGRYMENYTEEAYIESHRRLYDEII
jgi:glycosyltransferase involved in cell wall biosynthesis